MTACIRRALALRADLGVTDGSPGDLDGNPGVILHRLERVLRADMRTMASASSPDGERLAAALLARSALALVDGRRPADPAPSLPEADPWTSV